MAKTGYWIVVIVLIIIAGSVAWYYATLEEGSPTVPGTVPGTTGPAPIDAVRAHVAEEADVAAEQVQIVSVSAREWPDGCLGLAGEGEFCTQALVPGYEITVSINGTNTVYRTNTSASVIRKAP